MSLFTRTLFFYCRQNKLSYFNRFLKTSGTTNTSASNSVSVDVKDGIVHIFVPLPSRGETCVFQVKPFHASVGDFLNVLQQEDRGIDRAAIHLSDGSRLSRNTPIEVIFEQEFQLKINETTYDVQPPYLFSVEKPVKTLLSDVSNSITRLYHDLGINHYALRREKELEKQLTFLNDTIQPFQLVHHELAMKAIKQLKWLSWSGLAFLSFQTGILFRLVWIDYSWDIMEPITYFITYSTVFISYSYYVLRRQNYEYMNLADYLYLRLLHRLLRKKNFDMQRFNALKNEIMIIEHDLEQLKDPLQRIM